jgi:glyoxylase-like metal-dependent hydrolase (beta-lactamase superfamily II)
MTSPSPPTSSDSRRPRHWLWLPAGLAAILIVATTAALWQRPEPFDALPTLDPIPITVVRGVHLLGALAPSAAYVIETSDGLVLVDSGLQSDAALLRSQLDQLKLPWRNLRAILLTHIHGDHSGGAAQLRMMTQAKVYAGKGDAAPLRTGAPRDAFFSVFEMPYRVPHSTPVDVELQGGETLKFGSVRFRVLATPGHTPGSVCYLMERGSLRVLFSGDVVMSLRGDDRMAHPHLRTPLGTYAAYAPPRFRGDADAFLSSLRELRKLPAPQLVLPGHPRMDKTPQSPAITQAGWEDMLDKGIRDLETLVQRLANDGADFLDGIPKQLLADLYYLGDFAGNATYGLMAGGEFFVFGSPNGSRFLEFIRTRMQQLSLEPMNPTAIVLTEVDADDAAGLKELFQSCPCTVVVPDGAVSALSASCPPETTILPASELPLRGWFAVEPISFAGREDRTTAYQFGTQEKSVLITGRIPIMPEEIPYGRLVADMEQSKVSVADYLKSIDELGTRQPNIWLPATPSNGQNANLYDDEWQEILRSNRKLVSERFRP